MLAYPVPKPKTQTPSPKTQTHVRDLVQISEIYPGNKNKAGGVQITLISI